MDKMVIIFVSHRKQADYKLALELWYKEIMTIVVDPFEKSDLTKIKSFLANSVLQSV